MGAPMTNDFRIAFERVRDRVGERHWLRMSMPEVTIEICNELRALGAERMEARSTTRYRHQSADPLEPDTVSLGRRQADGVR
jgi:hypothetical protein